jgi:hypothetical protein
VLDFIVDDSATVRSSRPAQPFHGISTTTMQEEATCLEQLALAIREQSASRVHRTAVNIGRDLTLLHTIESDLLLPSLQDPEMWRLSVEVSPVVLYLPLTFVQLYAVR